MDRLYDMVEDMVRAGQIRKVGMRERSVFKVTSDCVTPSGVRAGDLWRPAQDK
jgi:hypothetical protein